jgi:hypothetical protein
MIRRFQCSDNVRVVNASGSTLSRMRCVEQAQDGMLGMRHAATFVQTWCGACVVGEVVGPSLMRGWRGWKREHEIGRSSRFTIIE